MTVLVYALLGLHVLLALHGIHLLILLAAGAVDAARRFLRGEPMFDEKVGCMIFVVGGIVGAILALVAFEWFRVGP